MSPQNQSKLSLPEIVLFVIIFLFTLHPVSDYDIWFHLKYGEHILANKSLPFTDIYSHSAFGRPAIPYEWLFQVLVFVLKQSFGLESLQLIVALPALFYFYFENRILKDLIADRENHECQPVDESIKSHIGAIPRYARGRSDMKLEDTPTVRSGSFIKASRSFRLIALSATFILTFRYWVERPQVMGYSFFILSLYLVLRFVITNSTRLWVLPILALLWSNMHASVVLIVYLLFAYALVVRVKQLFSRESSSRPLWKKFLATGIVTLIATLLPPLFGKEYQLLYQFMRHRSLLAQVIEEWTPLSPHQPLFYLYVTLAVFAMASLALSVKKRGSNNQTWIYLLPLLPIALLIFDSPRHAPFSLPALAIIIATGLTQATIFKPNPKSKFWQHILSFLVLSTLVAVSVRLRSASIFDKEYPTAAIPFIRKNLSGNMFNDYKYGGFLLYHLGPQIKTFIDGRTDMFLPEVLSDLNLLLSHKKASLPVLAGNLNGIFNKYRIAWAILPTRPGTVWRRISQILNLNPDWRLVYSDPNTEIYQNISASYFPPPPALPWFSK